MGDLCRWRRLREGVSQGQSRLGCRIASGRDDERVLFCFGMAGLSTRSGILLEGRKSCLTFGMRMELFLLVGLVMSERAGDV